MSPRYLEEELNKKYVSPNGKPWMVLNGADGAWKEPQPFILFSLYASSVDAVVNLGGFNEHYYFRPKGIERLEAPASNFLEVNPFAADENFGDAAIGWVMGRMAGTLALNPVLGHSHAAYMIIRGIEAVAKGKDSFKSSKRTTIASIFFLPPGIPDDPERMFTIQLGLYQKYLPDDGGGGERQRREVGLFPPARAGLEQDPDRGGEARGRRPVLRRPLSPDGRRHDDAAASAACRSTTWATSSRTRTGTIYADHIHYLANSDGVSAGNRLVAARIGELLAETWGLQRKP